MMKKALLIIVPIIAIALAGIALYYNNSKGDYYYDFDEVVYYKTTKGFDDLIAIDDKEVKTFKDSVTSQIMDDFGEIPYDVAAAYLDSIGFEKQVMPLSKHTALKEIFREKPTERTVWAGCAPIYRDIYVFKKNGKFSGMAKLCYECGLFRFIGTNANTEDFGMEGEFVKLRRIVK